MGEGCIVVSPSVGLLVLILCLGYTYGLHDPPPNSATASHGLLKGCRLLGRRRVCCLLICEIASKTAYEA